MAKKKTVPEEVAGNETVEILEVTSVDTEPAEKPKPIKKIDPREELVDVFVPRGEDKYVCVGERRFLIPASKHCQVPRFIARELERSEAANETFEDLSEKLQARE